MRNYASVLDSLPKYGARVIIGGTSFHFYKSIHEINFYSDKDYIVFELKDDKGVYIVVGKVGVSSDTELLQNYGKALKLLGKQDLLQNKLIF